eukprot:6011707-Prorocentrum_lima.AAC.1
MTVLDKKHQWVCQRLEWLSPAGIQKRCPAAAKGKVATGIMARTLGTEENSLTSAAGLKRILAFVPEHGDV